MGIEIERKFLVDHQKWANVVKPAGTPFRQGYLLNADNRTIRVRITDKHGYITLKGATTCFSRKEFEYTIPIEEGIELLDIFALSQLQKVRYCIDFEGKTWEVDEFAGDNYGLIMAEIELDDEAEEFTKPDWITTEVTGDNRFYNSYLSVNPYKNWGL